MEMEIVPTCLLCNFMIHVYNYLFRDEFNDLASKVNNSLKLFLLTNAVE